MCEVCLEKFSFHQRLLVHHHPQLTADALAMHLGRASMRGSRPLAMILRQVLDGDES